MENQSSMNWPLIAPCGINCGICMVYLREKKNCQGCNGIDDAKPAHCIKCSIKNCEIIKENKYTLCNECNKFPCSRIKRLDKRYRTNYKMSIIENLEHIKSMGIREFIKNEIVRWTCKSCGGIICVHKGYCQNCNEKK
ncbi:MAG: hypothetical protein JL50_03385 [Peptococcaceae bacterium BICA1-7]|nr:MAG: hypothetical protein JL50_03385 [Peptococcaceae bacterium BICA1-7]HBV97692.1 DUF3795 domain-containing protein [Desulfotomaculum sp.]